MKEAEKEMAREYYLQLTQEESIPLTIVSSIAACIPAFIYVYLIAAAEEARLPVLLFLVPGVFIGFCARVGGGKIFRPKVRVIPAIIATVFMLSMNLFFTLGFYNLFILPFVNGAIAYTIAKRSLTERQEMSLYQVKRGLVKLND